MSTNNKPNDVRVVSVELLEEIVSNLSFCGARHKLTEILAQPADQQGEPVGRVMSEAELPVGFDRRTGPVIWFGTPEPGLLYRHAQPTTAKVVLPERRELSQSTPYLSDLDHEWNACLDEVAKLNGGQS